jgi:hypothetical protein
LEKEKLDKAKDRLKQVKEIKRIRKTKSDILKDIEYEKY